jgi:hypothetical protein
VTVNDFLTHASEALTALGGVSGLVELIKSVPDHKSHAGTMRTEPETIVVPRTLITDLETRATAAETRVVEIEQRLRELGGGS